jgi:DNA-binding transcriptional ArsR family regulator
MVMARNSKALRPCPADDENMRTMSGSKRKEKLALLAKGLSHPARVEIVRMLANKPPDCRCICGNIVKALPLAQSSVSQHLNVLKETGWVTSETRGTTVCYCLVDGILEFYQNLMKRIIINN